MEVLTACLYMGAGIVLGITLLQLTQKDLACRYADPEIWRPVWLVVCGATLAMWVTHSALLQILHSLFWIVIVYLLAKIPAIKVMGGQDARILICAGLLFPHWLTIPLVFCVALVSAGIARKRLSPAKRAEWQELGIPMVPFLCVGFLAATLLFPWYYLI